MRTLAVCSILASILAIAPTAAQDTRVGIAAAARNDVTGTFGSAQRALKIGDGVVQNEQIRTGAASSAQVLFRDETTLTMGADSVVVLDKAIYDPNKRTGEIAVRAVSGAFRFMSGSSPSNNYRVITTAGTIGVRGTIVDVEVAAAVLVMIVREGAAEFCLTGGSCTNVRAGQYIIVAGGQASVPKTLGDHVCGMTGLGAGQNRCAAQLLGGFNDFAHFQFGSLGVDFQPGTFTGGPPPSVTGFTSIVGSGPGTGPGAPGSCTVLLPNGNCFTGVGSPGQGTAPPGLNK